jgi:hypothetical protein
VDLQGVDLELSTGEGGVDFAEDWASMSDMINGTHYKTTLDAYLPALEPSSFTPPGFPASNIPHTSAELLHLKSSVDSRQEVIQSGPACSCTSESLAIIPELQECSIGRAKLSVDGILHLTRRGTSTVSSHFDCPNHINTNLSQTSLLACILVLMQVAACYTVVRGSLEDPELRRSMPVSVGGLNIEDDETRRKVVNAVLDAEIRGSLALSRRLETWGMQLQTAPNALSCDLLLSSIHKELEKSLGQQTQA